MATATKSRKGNGNNSKNNDQAETQTTETKAPARNSIHSLVQKSGGIAKINLGQLRDELGFQRIGRKVLSKMSDHMTDSGLGFFPGWALDEESNPEPRQWQEVWVYERDGSARSAILDAVAYPDVHDLAAAFAMFTDEAPDYSSLDDSQRLALVRAVVCQ